MQTACACEMLWLVTKIFLFLIFRRVGCTDCPNVCRCFTNHDLQTITIDCRGQDLTSIPSPLPNGTSHLDVSNNRIQSVLASDFPSEVSGLKHLQLQNNEIIFIDPEAFSSLSELETLTLHNNYQLKNLENGTFDGLGNLQKLIAYNIGLKTLSPQLFIPLENVTEIDLSSNELMNISMGTFQDLQRLKILSLSNNFITTLQAGSFNNLTALRYLRLDNNQLMAVPPMAFIGFDRIATIALNGNPIHCGCSALYLYDFLTSKTLSGPVCEGPQLFRGRLLLDLRRNEFCALPTATLSPSENFILIMGSRMQLNCTVTGIPPPQVTWSRDGMTLPSNGSRIIIVGGTLLITNTRATDSGEYHCSASSTAGSVSSSVEVAVLESTEAPTTLAVVRENAVLECSSQVPPGVSVHWMFNNSTLAPLSNKYVVLRNGSLLILDLWVEDMGDYLCQIGQVTLIRTLNLTALPEITSINQGRCAELETLRIDSDINLFVLRCVAMGIPTPIVEWQLNGTTLPLPSQSINGQEEVRLEILRPDKTDEGNYTCIANNSIGSVSVTRNLIVRIITLENGGQIHDITQMAGETVIMECPVTNIEFEPGSRTTWEREDRQLLPLDRINYTCSNQTLVIRDAVSTADIAEYICHIEEPSGRRFQGNVFLRLFEPATIQRVCAAPEVLGSVNSSVELLCPAVGNPEPMRVWTRKGEILEDGGRISIIDRGARLIIAQLQEEDNGLYNCTASNMVGSDFYIIRLFVQRLPQFLSAPMNVSVVSGESIQLPCSGDGNPTPFLTWWRLEDGNSSEIHSDGQHFVTRDFLLLTRTSLVDEGLYYCNLSSPAGTFISDMIFVDVLTSPILFSFRPSHTLKSGDMDAVLRCSGSGDPEPVIQWFRLPDMTVVPSPESSNYVRNGSDLVILSVSRADAGLYRCVLTNVAGQVFQDVQVIVKAPPETSVEPESVRANVGCQVVLTCLDGGKPPVNFRWSFNDMPLQTRPGVLIRDAGELVLSDLEVVHSGNYSCTVQGSIGRATGTAILTVEDPLFSSGAPSFAPSITSPTPPTQVLPLKQTAQFVCLVEGFPPPQVIWLRNGKPQPNFRRVTLLNESLSIRDLRSTDKGTYECVATNALGEERLRFQLTIPAPPFIITHPQPQVVTMGANLTLSCLAGGNPAPEISWFFNGSEILSSDEYFISPSSNALTVFNASIEEDAGVYTCVANNIAGTSKHSVTVNIELPMSPPAFVRVPFSSRLTRGEDVMLMCTVEGVPEPNVMWFFLPASNITWQTLPNCLADSDIRNESFACVMEGVLVIQNASQELVGRYLCSASNAVGTSAYEVTISLKPEQNIPTFLVSPLPLWVSNGSQFSLDCVAEGSPFPTVSWFLNMEPVNLTTGDFQQLENNTLRVPVAQEDTVGFFTCMADNDISISRTTVQVDLLPVESGASGVSPVVTTFPLGLLTLLPGQSTVLDCTASGGPPPTISWTRNGIPISAAFSRFHVASNGSLILTNLTRADEGNYTCMAVNQAGTSVSPFFLEINEQIVMGSTSATALVLAGASVQMEDTTSIKGFAILWQHRGKVVHESNVVKVESNGSLTISTARLEDAGHYKCLVATSRGWRETDFLLHVEPKREPPFFTLEPGDVHLVKKGFVMLPCRAASPGGEVTHIHWLYGGRNVSQTGPRHLILPDNSLLLTNVRIGEAGQYSCVATNQYGESHSTAQVTISRFEVDHFITTVEGSSMLLSCGLGEGVGVKWTRNQDPVPSYSGRVLLFMINHTHQGEYACTYGKQGLNYYLTVQSPPRITTFSATVSSKVGAVASLHCMAVGRPEPRITWHHNRFQLERGDWHSILTNGTLLVYKVERGRDDGVYTCKAHNTVGMDMTRILLLVTAL